MLKFSILVPAYNAEKYILDNLNSIKFQTYTNWELIIVNDGSTDKTQYIVEQFIIDNPNLDIQLINIPNGGLANARNIAIKHASGDYFCNLDADDYLSIDILNNISIAYKQEKSDIYFYGWRDFEDGSMKLTGHYTDRFEQPTENLSGPFAALLKLQRKIWICQGSAFYNLNMIRNKEIWNIPEINQGEDLYFITRALLVSCKVRYIPYEGFNCRYRAESMMHAKFNSTHKEVLQAIQFLLKDVSSYSFLGDLKDSIIRYIKREYLIEEVHISKRIIDATPLKQLLVGLQQLKSNSPLKTIDYSDVKKIMSFSHKLQYIMLTYFPWGFFCMCKLYRFFTK